MFARGIGTKLKLPVIHVFYKTLSTKSRNTSLCVYQPILTNTNLSRCCSVNSKVLITEQSKSVNQPENMVISTIKPYLELMRFSRPIGLKIILFFSLNLLIIKYFDHSLVFRMVAFILAMYLEYCFSFNCRRTSQL